MVIGCVDSNSLVAGKGIERLKKAGIHVVVGVLEDECRKHHKRFFTFQDKNRPYIILKWAETANGFIAPLKRNTVAPVFISNQYSQQRVHKLRAKEHAILVGTNTVIADNPSLNVRSWFGNSPIRIVLDKNLRTPKISNVYDNTLRTIFITSHENCKKVNQKNSNENISFEGISFNDNIANQICEVLQKNKIQSLIVEGGTQTLQTFIDANIWDEAMVFVGKINFENGIKAPNLSEKILSEENIQNDILKTYLND